MTISWPRSSPESSRAGRPRTVLRISVALLVLALCATLSVGAAAAAGVVNGDFETGSISGWTAVGSRAPVVAKDGYGGSYGATLYTNKPSAVANAASSITQNVDLTDAKELTLVYSVPYSNGQTGSTRGLKVYVDGRILMIKPTLKAQSSWTTVTLPVSGKTGAKQIKVEAYVTGLGSGSDIKVRVDNIRVVYGTSGGTAPTPTPTQPVTTPTPTKTPTPTPTPTPSQSNPSYGCESNPTGNPIGGGAGYSDIISENDPRIVARVSDAAGLVNALSRATSGQIVYVMPGSSIDMNGRWKVTIPAGVTLASSRGASGTPGRIYHSNNDGLSSQGFPRAIFSVGGDNVRVTGLVIEGPDKGSARMEGTQIRSAILNNGKKNLLVDNNEIFGFSHSGVYFRTTSATGTVRHNNIHNNQANGFGYGVIADGGKILVEANSFDYTRHAIACNGAPGTSYEARYNYCGPHSTNHVFDVHGYPEGSSNAQAGASFSIHHNTFASSMSAVGIRGKPTVGATVAYNRFVGAQDDRHVVFQANNFGNLKVENNLVGPSDTVRASGPIYQISSLW